MAIYAADSIWFNATSAGLVDFVVASAISAYRTPAQASVPDGSTIHYSARTTTEFENGEGIYTSGTVTLSRVTIFASSNAGAKVNFGSVPTVAISPLAEDAIFPPASSTNNAIVLWDGSAGDAVKNSSITVSGSGALSGTNSGDQTITLTGDVTGSGTGSFAATIAANQKIRAIEFVIDGGGSVVTAGTKGFLEVPFGCTIDRWTLIGDVSGSVTVDVWKAAFATGSVPTNANSITASATPAISSTFAAQSSTLTGWTTSITAGDILGFAVEGSPATITKVTISLRVNVT